MEDQLAILHGLWGEPDGWTYEGVTGIKVEGSLFRPRPVDVPGRPRTPIGGARPRIITGGQGSPRSYRLAAATPTSSTCRRRHRPRRPRSGWSWTPPARRSGAIRRRSRARRWPACSSAGPRTRSRPAKQRCWPPSGQDAEDGEAWLEERRERWVYGTPDEARAQLDPVRRGRAWSGSCSRTSCPGTSTWSTSWARSSSAACSAGPTGTVSPARRRPRGSDRRRGGSGRG